MLKDISSHSYYVNLHYQIQTRTMTRIKQNDDISDVNGNKRKGGNKNPDSKKLHTKYMAAKDKDNQKRARGNSSILVSRTPKRNISDRNSVEKETNNDTRELVLPSDSNVVKGNV